MGACDNLWGLDQYNLVRIPIKKACNGYYLRWYYSGWHYWFFLPGNYSKITEGENYRTIGTRQIRMSTGQITTAQAKAIRTILNTREVYLLTIAGWMNIRLEPGQVNIFDNRVGSVEFEIVAVIGSKEISYTSGYSPVTDVPVITPVPTYCEITIGTQIWMCYNWDSDYPGSLVYNDNLAYVSLFGRLYKFDQINNPGFCPAGWHIPTKAEWETLINYCGGQVAAGGVLKEIGNVNWNPPNTGAVDTYGFAARGAGVYNPYGYYEYLRMAGQFWTADEYDALSGYAVQMTFDNAGAFVIPESKQTYTSLRLIKDNPLNPGDVMIGTQVWKDSNVSDNIPGSRVYNDDEANRALFGGMYEWSMIAAIEAANPGYHVPTKTEAETLQAYLGGELVAGGKLKETGTTYWDAPNTGATNEVGFNGRGGGRWFGGSYSGLRQNGRMWLNTDGGGGNAYHATLSNTSQFFSISVEGKGVFKQVRLIRD